jgi:hypothetical protein
MKYKEPYFRTCQFISAIIPLLSSLSLPIELVSIMDQRTGEELPLREGERVLLYSWLNILAHKLPEPISRL